MSVPPAIVAVSQHGRRLAARLEGRLIEGSPREALAEAWRTSREIVFFGAAGIAVRLLAPLLGDKTTDPAVVVVDDAGRHAISLVSGHEGGANELAKRVARRLGAEAVLTTASEILPDRSLTVGIGCSSGVSARELQELVGRALAECGASLESVEQLASIDLKRDEPALLELAARWHLPVRWFSAAELREVPVPNPSSVVAGAVGTPSVAEAAALLAATGPRRAPGDEQIDAGTATTGSTAALGHDGELLVSKQRSSMATAAVARRLSRGHLAVVGLGPGGREQLTYQAVEELRAAEVVVGYTLYVDMVREWLPLATWEAMPLGEETERAQRAVELARAGKRVALICSGDAGIYALAGLVYEALGDDTSVRVDLVPGVTAGTSAAALLGAPLMADFAAISLSDLHMPIEVIRRRLRAAAEAGLVTVLYNPASRRRRQLLADAQAIFLRHRAPSTPVGLVRNAYRPDQSVRVVALSDLPLDDVDMFTVIVIGNSSTHLIGGHMVTARS